MNTFPVTGSGLGFRRGTLMEELEKNLPDTIDFMEVAPENWIPMGNALKRKLKAFSEKGGKKHLYRLFPYGPLFTIHLLAQLPRLRNDVDPHFGTAY
jgi:hypothetical protein